MPKNMITSSLILKHVQFHTLTNATLLDITSDANGLIIEANGTNGSLYVSLPKTIPILDAETVPGFVLLNGEEITYHTDNSKYSYNFQVPVTGNTTLEFIFTY